MSQTIKLKRKFTSGAPGTDDLVEGEVAINTADQKIYMRDASNNIVWQIHLKMLLQQM